MAAEELPTAQVEEKDDEGLCGLEVWDVVDANGVLSCQVWMYFRNRFFGD